MEILDKVLLDRYAELAIRVGLNLQSGQRLIIGTPSLEGKTPIETALLVRLITKHAYQAGASLVEVIWDDDELRRIRLKYANQETLKECLNWQFEGMYKSVQNGDALLVIYGHDPDLMIDQDPDSMAIVQKANNMIYHPIRELISRGETNWSMIAAPVSGWTKKLFPHLSPEAREKNLWDILFKICRITNSDPIAAWQEHIHQLKVRSEYLSRKQYDTLRFRSSGTDLLVGLPKGHFWSSGCMTSKNGIKFTPNIPTEEVFTMPHKDKADGVVKSSRSLLIGGSVIEDFSLTFKNGKVIKVNAKRGEESLKKIIETDVGSSRLGEVALVPNSSPISQSGIHFYNTLIDENAASHLALGNAYNYCLIDGSDLSNDEYSKRGGNQSMIHVDFMFGSDDMDVDGITSSGLSEPVMRSGEWVL